MSLLCECGQEKPSPKARCCYRCAVLDGERTQDWLCIDALRAVGGQATTDALETETGWSRRQVLRAVERLKGLGRVRRIETEQEGHRLIPIFVLQEHTAPPTEQPHALQGLSSFAGGQLAFSGSRWVGLCRHARTEQLIASGGGVIGAHCRQCGQCGAVIITEISNEANNSSSSHRRKRRTWTQLVIAAVEAIGHFVNGEQGESNA